MFYILFYYLIKHKILQNKIFCIMRWGFYGLAFLLPVNARNISYNFLDLFAKNFYGVFIYIVILRQYRQEKKID